MKCRGATRVLVHTQSRHRCGPGQLCGRARPEQAGVRPAALQAAGPVLRLAQRPQLLADREDLLGELDTRLGRGDQPGPIIKTDREDEPLSTCP